MRCMTASLSAGNGPSFTKCNCASSDSKDAARARDSSASCLLYQSGRPLRFSPPCDR